MVVAELDDVTQIVIASSWLGLGSPMHRSAELTIVQRQGFFHVDKRADLPIEANDVRALLMALGEQEIDRPDVTNMGFSPEWFDHNIKEFIEELFRDYSEDGKKRLQTKLCAFGNFAELVCRQFRMDWTDDCPKVSVAVYFYKAKPIKARSTSQHVFMIPWHIQEPTKSVQTHNANISRAVARLLPVGFLNKERLMGQVMGRDAVLTALTFMSDEDLVDRPTRMIHGHEKRIASLGLTTDQKNLISSSWDKRVKVWDTQSWTERIVFDMPRRGAIVAVAIGADNATIAFGDASVLKLANLEKGQIIREIEGHGLVVRRLRLSGDGRWLASEDRNGVILWDLARDDASRRFNREQLVGFSFDGARLFTIAQQKLVARDVVALQPMSIADTCELAYLSQDGTKMAWKTGESTLFIWDVELNRQLERVEVSVPVTSLQVTRTGSMVAYSNDDARKVFVLYTKERSTGEIAIGGRSNPSLQEFTFSPDDRFLIAIYDTCFIVWDTTTRKRTATVHPANPIECLTVSSDGKTFLTGHSDGSFGVWTSSSLAPGIGN